MKEYVLAFSSFYKAAYAQEKLNEYRIRSTLKKLPPELMSSCGYCLYLKTDSIEKIKSILSKSNIETRGIFVI